MILGIQFFGLLFGLVMVYISFINYKRKDFTFNEWIFWVILSVAFMAVSVFPQILEPVVESLSLSRALDLFIIIGFMFLIAAVFYTYMITRRTQRSMEELVRKIALKKKK
ncbi:MAG: DUF2304 domain-containing protein [bacterium]|nr:DUF2304 domain-containing protein [bacterium]